MMRKVLKIKPTHQFEEAWLDFTGEPRQLKLPLGPDKWVRVWDGRKAEPPKRVRVDGILTLEGVTPWGKRIINRGGPKWCSIGFDYTGTRALLESVRPNKERFWFTLVGDVNMRPAK